MRICFLNQNRGVGGAERHMAELARHWSNPEDLRVLTLEGDVAGPVPAPSAAKLIWALRLLPKLRRAILEGGFEAVVTFLWVPTLLTALALTGARNKPRLIWSVQSDLARDFERHRDGRLRLLLLRCFLPRCVDHAIAVSSGLRTRLLTLLPRMAGRVSVIPNGIDLERFQPHPHAPSCPSGIHAVTVGRLHYAKGIDVLLRALQILDRQGVRVTCSIVGDGPERTRLEQLAAELGVDIRFEGLQPDPRLWVRAADMFISPSRWETFGVAIAEAMAMGIPVIATATDGARSLIRDGVDGLLADPEEPESLANAIARLARDAELRSRLGAAARVAARAWDIRGVVRSYEETIEAVVRPPVKIVRIITRLNIGGPAIQAVLLTRQLAHPDYRSLLISGVCEPSDGDMSYLLNPNDPVRWLPEMSRSVNPWSNLRALFRLWRWLREEKPSIVHTHTAMAGSLGRAAAILARVPVIVHTFHGNSLRGYFSPLASRVFLGIERLLAGGTHAICVVSSQQRDELSGSLRVAPARKIRVIPLGLDLDRFMILPPPAPSGLLRIGWFGRLVGVKNIPLLVRIVDLACAERDDVEFHIAGDGPEREAVREAAARWPGRVHWHGWQRDILPLLARCDALIQTSRNEGTPVALIEGMAAARPFISTPAGGVVDLVSGSLLRRAGGCEWYENAVLAGPDPEAFVHALRQMTVQPAQIAEMGRAARAFAAERHTKHKLLTNLDGLYQELLRADAGVPATQAAPVIETAAKRGELA